MLMPGISGAPGITGVPGTSGMPGTLGVPGQIKKVGGSDKHHQLFSFHSLQSIYEDIEGLKSCDCIFSYIL